MFFIWVGLTNINKYQKNMNILWISKVTTKNIFFQKSFEVVKWAQRGAHMKTQDSSVSALSHMIQLKQNHRHKSWANQTNCTSSSNAVMLKPRVLFMVPQWRLEVRWEEVRPDECSLSKVWGCGCSLSGRLCGSTREDDQTHYTTQHNTTVQCNTPHYTALHCSPSPPTPSHPQPSLCRRLSQSDL